MDRKNAPLAAVEGAEARRRRRQEDEGLGRMAWAESTRSGANVPAATTEDLIAMGAQVRAGLGEGLSMADAVMRSAANTATLGLADNAAAGVNALLGQGGEGDFLTRYDRLYQDELRKSETYGRERPITTAAGELGMTLATATGAAIKGARVVSGLPSKTKGEAHQSPATRPGPVRPSLPLRPLELQRCGPGCRRGGGGGPAGAGRSIRPGPDHPGGPQAALEPHAFSRNLRRDETGSPSNG